MQSEREEEAKMLLTNILFSSGRARAWRYDNVIDFSLIDQGYNGLQTDLVVPKDHWRHCD